MFSLPTLSLTFGLALAFRLSFFFGSFSFSVNPRLPPLSVAQSMLGICICLQKQYRYATVSMASMFAPYRRPIPASGFQAPPPPLPAHLQRRLQQAHGIPQEEMDHSFVGMSGGDIFHEMMLRHNVKHIFGYPGELSSLSLDSHVANAESSDTSYAGGAILPVFDAIHDSKHFDFILRKSSL